MKEIGGANGMKTNKGNEGNEERNAIEETKRNERIVE